MDDLLNEFLVETSDRLAELDADIERFAEDPTNERTQVALSGLFHTIKGASGFLLLARLEGIAQACEDVLAAMRDGKLPAQIGAEAAIAAVATTKRILRGIATTGAEPAGDDRMLLTRLAAALAGERTPTSPSRPLAPPRSEMLSSAVASRAEEAGGVAQSTPHTERTASSRGPGGEAKASGHQPANVSVPGERLDAFANLVGELVLTRNNIEYLMRSRDDVELEESVQKLSHVTSDLGASVIATRRQALGSGERSGEFDILRALTVESGGRRFAIPQRSVSELVWVTPSGSLGTANDEFRFLRLRDGRWPWIRLSTLLRIEADQALARRREIVAMIQAGTDEAFGLSVERVFDAEEILVRSQPPVLGTVALYSGNAILGDGSVAMVLDPAGVLAELKARQHRMLADKAAPAIPHER